MTTFDRDVNYLERLGIPVNTAYETHIPSFQDKMLVGERQLIQRAQAQAKQIWKNKFGEWVASELGGLMNCGLKFDDNSKIKSMLDALNSMYLEALEKGNINGTG